VAGILLVDDSPFVLDELCRIIRDDGGFAVAGRAGNGIAALELAERTRPEVVCLDVDMPVLNGLATLKHLMTRRPVPTVMLSALTGAASPVSFECLRLGAVDVLEKPGGRAGRNLALQKSEILRELRRAAAVDPSSTRLGRMKRPPAKRPAGTAERPGRLVLVSAGRAAFGSLLSILNSFPLGRGAALVAKIDVQASVLRDYAAYAEPFSALRLEASPIRRELTADAAYLVSAEEAGLVVAEGRGALRLAPCAPGGDKALDVESLFESVSEELGAAAMAVVLAGAPRGTVEGLRHVAFRGGRSAGVRPESVADAGVLRRAIDAGILRPARDVETLSRAVAAHVLAEEAA